MKKIIAIILALVCICTLVACASAPETNGNTATNNDSQNNVPGFDPTESEKNLVTVYLKETVTSNGDTAEFTYDSNGYLIGSSSKSSICSYEYDEKGNLILEIQQRCGIGDETYSQKIEIKYTYDDMNNLIEQYRTDTHGYTQKDVYTYDESNRKIHTETYLPPESDLAYESIYQYEGNTVTRTKYSHYSDWTQINSIVNSTYDDNGNLLISEQYTINKDIEEFEAMGLPDVPSWCSIYTYDEESRVLEYTYQGDGETLKHIIYTYNEEGLLIQEDTSHYTGSTDTTTYIYDEHGNLIEVTNYQNEIEEVLSSSTYVYDEHGNLIEETIYERGKDTFTKTYTYVAVLVTTERAEELKNQN